jgi:hypothetical protein
MFFFLHNSAAPDVAAGFGDAVLAFGLLGNSIRQLRADKKEQIEKPPDSPILGRLVDPLELKGIESTLHVSVAGFSNQQVYRNWGSVRSMCGWQSDSQPTTCRRSCRSRHFVLRNRRTF